MNEINQINNTIIRKHKLSDAERFFDILNNPNIIDTGPRPSSIENEEEWIRRSLNNWEEGKQYNFTIEYKKEIVGCLGLKINSYRKYIGEIGCFIDEQYRNKGIATHALSLGVDFGFNKLHLQRIETISPIDNISSQKVAIKSGFHKEGVLRSAIKSNNGTIKDVVIFSKVISDILLNQ